MATSTAFCGGQLAQKNKSGVSQNVFGSAESDTETF
jgi:hypothetical protein